jgi:hypothetical protein
MTAVRFAPSHLRSLLAALLIGGVFAVPATAQEAPDACRAPVADIDAAVTTLAAEGWTPLPEGPLPQDIADQLVWLYVAQYTTGDSGGEALTALVELQARTVTGIVRKRDIPTSKTRILTGESGAMILMWRASSPGRVTLQCRTALTGPDAPGATLIDLAGAQRSQDDTVMRIALDRAGLAAATGRDVVTAQLIETSITFNLEKSE